MITSATAASPPPRSQLTPMFKKSSLPTHLRSASGQSVEEDNDHADDTTSANTTATTVTARGFSDANFQVNGDNHYYYY